MSELIKSWAVGGQIPHKRKPDDRATDRPQPDQPLLVMKSVKVKALTVVNVGKGHYMPGQEFDVAPSLSKELKAAGLVEIVGDSDVPKEARADDGQYAEEPGTDLATLLTRTKVAGGEDIEEAVAAIPEKTAEADNKAIADAETAKDVTVTGVEPDQKTIDMEKEAQADRGPAKSGDAADVKPAVKEDKSAAQTKDNKEAKSEATK